jgi:hypothetical protein
MKPLTTPAERGAGEQLAEAFGSSGDTLQARLECFPRYARRKTITRFITLYELFKLVVPVKGSVVECGVFRGFGLMTWAHLSAVLEPANLTRRIYGFDTFEGFPSVAAADANATRTPAPGELAASSFDELKRIVDIYDSDRFLGHIDKVHMVRGDVATTIPAFLNENRHLVISLLFLDLDLWEPTKVAIEQLVPRMPRGAVIAFDELDNPIWPGETQALMDTLGINKLRIRRFEWDPYVGYAVID